MEYELAQTDVSIQIGSHLLYVKGVWFPVEQISAHFVASPVVPCFIFPKFSERDRNGRKGRERERSYRNNETSGKAAVVGRVRGAIV